MHQSADRHAGVAAPATANLGTLYPSADLKTAAIAAGKVPAKCEGRGILTSAKDRASGLCAAGQQLPRIRL